MSASNGNMRYGQTYHGPGAAETPGGGGLRDARNTAENLFREGDDIIERSLSGDSMAFLRASRQQGGQ